MKPAVSPRPVNKDSEGQKPAGHDEEQDLTHGHRAPCDDFHLGSM